jgi:hypothetical protein
MPASAGLWVAGRDLATNYAAVAVSHDAGRTWSTRIFGPGETDLPTSMNYADPLSTSLDGQTAYTVVMTNGDDDRTRRSFVYRTDDGGATWQRVDPRRTLPYSYHGGASFIAADGTHVVTETSNSRLVWWTSRDRGGSYARAQLAGLGEVSEPVRVAAPGSYMTFNRDAVFRSTDGLTWTRLEINAK